MNEVKELKKTLGKLEQIVEWDLEEIYYELSEEKFNSGSIKFTNDLWSLMQALRLNYCALKGITKYIEEVRKLEKKKGHEIQYFEYQKDGKRVLPKDQKLRIKLKGADE